METDSTPQARFVKNTLRKEHPQLSEEEIEAMWQQMRDKAKAQDDNDCLACGS